MVFSRKIPLKKLLHKTTIDTIEPFISRVNSIIIDAYKFLKLFFIQEFKNNKVPPVIDRKLMNNIYYLITNRKRKISYLKQDEIKDLQDFYDKHFCQLQHQKVDGNRLGQFLDQETIQLQTNVENICNFNFYNYIKLLSKCYLKLFEEKNYKLVHKLTKSFYKNKVQSGCENYTSVVQEWGPLIQEGLEKTGQERLPLMYKMLHFVESQNLNLKLLNLLPLRSSLIPCSICITKSSCKEDMGDEAIWDSISKRACKKFQTELRTKSVKLNSMRTDGVYASLFFGTEKYKKGVKKPKKTKGEEIYVDNYDWSSEQKKTVQIDPNKGNLLYCLGNHNVKLRYTQNTRRKHQKKTRYKQIRQKLEKDDKDQLDVIIEELKKCNKKTVDFQTFKEYIIIKNKYEKSFQKLYCNKTYRKLRFNTWMNTKRSEDLFVKKFKEVYGDENEIIVTIGDWEQRKGISLGKEPTIGKGMRDVFRRHGYKVLLIDERLTSKRCCKCKNGESNNEYSWQTRQDPRPWMQGKTQTVWELSRCTKCGVIHNRDTNAVKNMREIIRACRNGQERPSYLTTKTSNPVPT